MGRDLELASQQRGVAAAEEALADMFATDKSHDVPDVTKIKLRLVVDLEIAHNEPLKASPDAIVANVKSYLLKTIAAHRYMQFESIRIRGGVDDD